MLCPTWTSRCLKVVENTKQIHNKNIRLKMDNKVIMEFEAESENLHPAVCRNPVLHFHLLGSVALGRVRWHDEIQNSQLLISAEVITRGWGEAEIIF